MIHLRLMLRGWLIVTLTAGNVHFIANERWLAACLTGGAISWVWWSNAHASAHVRVRGARACYALGAAVGTVTGMWLAGHLA